MRDSRAYGIIGHMKNATVTIIRKPTFGEVWCDFAETYAVTRDGFCEFCGSTKHGAYSPTYRHHVPSEQGDYTGGCR